MNKEKSAVERDAFYLAQENKILKQENIVLRDTVVAKMGSVDNEKVLLQVMEMQRKRIENLESGKPYFETECLTYSHRV